MNKLNGFYGYGELFDMFEHIRLVRIVLSENHQ